MPQFVKKPVVVDAWQNYTGDPVIDGKLGLAMPAPAWINAAVPAGKIAVGPNGSILIQTLEGQMRADVGDWIIRDDKGELYPCKPDIFAATYEPARTDSFDFGVALRMLRDGRRVRRAGWNGKGMWVALTEGGTITPRNGTPTSGAAALLANFEQPDTIRLGSHIDMRAADGSLVIGSLVIGWLASQTDMLATDWELVK